MENIIKQWPWALVFIAFIAVFTLSLNMYESPKMDLQMAEEPILAKSAGADAAAEEDIMEATPRAAAMNAEPEPAGAVADEVVEPVEAKAAEDNDAAAPVPELYAEESETESYSLKVAVEPEPNYAWSAILFVLIGSLIGTLLSWTVVEKVIKRRRNVVLVSFSDAKGKKVVQALANETCKKILDALSKGGMTSGQLAEKLNMSIPRIQYNMKQLVDAKLVQVKSFSYSEKGREMDIYTLTNKYFVIGPEERK
ncbi:helix-turn-helix domain-containing protein [Nanoarchaeota archaeon]